MGRGVIFDIDGTLVDSIRAHAESWAETLATPYDVEAAVRAGVRIVVVRSGGWNDESLAGASAIYDDVGVLLSEYQNSVFQGVKS